MGLCQTETCVQVNITDDKKLEKMESFTLTLEKLITTDPELLYLYDKISLTPSNLTTINITDNEPLPLVIQTHTMLYTSYVTLYELLCLPLL